MYRRWLRLALLTCVLLTPAIAAIGVAAEEPANDAFQSTWARTDQPVAALAVSRTWMWGPKALTAEMHETYAEASGGQRSVQYFDKSRMEITYPDADPTTTWYVTNGLLVVELITGEMQLGDATFQERSPAQVNVAGDLDDPNAPTYATFTDLLASEPRPVDSTITERLSRSGQLTDDPDLAERGVTVALVDGVTNHAIAAPFWDFMNSSGIIASEGAFVEAPLFADPYFATGRPITEAYWVAVEVSDEERDVLVQCFERRCLTYTPENEAGWQVEAGNVGQHYYVWRYDEEVDLPPEPAPPGVTSEIGPEGGSLETESGDAMLNVPAGAVTEPVEFSIAPAEQDHPEYVLASVLFGPDDIEFEEPLEVSLRYDADALPDDADDSDLMLFRVTNAAWQPLGNIQMDEGTSIGSGTTLALAEIALVNCAHPSAAASENLDACDD